MKAIRLKSAHLINPLGIDVHAPLLTWICEGGIRQTAFQVIAEQEGGALWDSGRVETDAMQVAYAGPAASRMRVTWRVRLWDEEGRAGDWSEAAWFEYALLAPEDFHAAWIDPETETFDPKQRQPASVLRRTFEVRDAAGARLYATAHGMYTLYLNGRRVDGNVLTPGTSEYWYRMPYQTFDVETYLTVGKNTIEVVLGDGWWRGSNGNTGTRNVFGTDIALWLQLDVNGETVLKSDDAWQAAQDGPIRFNDLQLGERVDARMTTSAFHPVRVKDYGVKNLLCANTVPLREMESFSAKLIVTPSGKKVLDFEQNLAGYVSFRINARAGQTLRMTHGEFIGSDGEFSDANLQTMGRKGGELHQVIEYTCKDGLNEYTPTLCVFGFQYVLVETDIVIDGSEFTAHAVYSDMRQTATFECDRPLVNQLFHNALWSQKSNFVDIPTDCPQRERSGWTGDAALYCRTGLTLMDAYAVYARWLCECRVDQYPDGRVYNMSPRRSAKPSRMDEMYDGSTAWGDASVIVPYTMYSLYGDKRILEENYQFMKNWLGYCERKAKKSRLRNRFKKNPHKNYIIDTGMHYGEWLEAGISMEQSMKDMIFNGVPDIATAYFAASSHMLSEIAGILGKREEAEYYAELHRRVLAAYRYLEVRDGHIHSERQCRYVRPLQLGLLEPEDAERAAADLNALVVKNNYHLNTGFLTTPHLCAVLAEYGYVETAYRLLLQEDTPGWLYQVKQGATTVWESWEGNTGSTGVASLNHYSKGAVVSWLIEGICGIRVNDGRITIKPQPNPLMRHAQASFDSPLGRIESGWKYAGDQVEYTVTIPANTTARFIAPDGRVTELSPGTRQMKG